MQLSTNFSIEELVASQTAARLGIDNTPSLTIIANLRLTAAGLEEVRILLDSKPIHVDSGYRCQQLNEAVGGALDSDHLRGLAADIICPQFGTPLEICLALAASEIEFDKAIQEGTWCHISFGGNKRKTMTAHFGPGGTTYTEGIEA